MADLDLETVERVARWCAEAGRQASPAEIRAALGPLGWDELLAARALLADPPPARPLGPFALADLARGAPADVAAEREREGRYPKAHPPDPAGPPAAAPPVSRRRGKARLQVIVRKPAPAPAAPPPPPPLPLLDELLLPAGRGALERLIRAHGGRRPALLGSLGASHRRADGLPVDDGDLDRLLEHHGLARAFARRQRDEVLHAVRAAGGVLARAAASLGYDPAGLAAAVARLGCDAEVESIRAGKRRDLAGRATLSDRARLVLADPAGLAELGLLAPFEAELGARLPELLEVLGRSEEPLALALARSLSLPVKGLRELSVRLGLDLGPVTFAETEAGDRPPPRFRADRPDRPARAPRPAQSRSGPSGDRAARSAPRGSAAPRPGPSGPGPARSGPVRSRPSRSGPPGSRPDRPGASGGGAGGTRPPGPHAARGVQPRSGPSGDRAGPRSDRAGGRGARPGNPGARQGRSSPRPDRFAIPAARPASRPGLRPGGSRPTAAGSPAPRRAGPRPSGSRRPPRKP